MELLSFRIYYNMQYLRTISLCGVALLAGTFLYAQAQQKVTIQNATVFLKGAELTNIARITLPLGESEILFTNIAGNVNEQSITVGVGNSNVVVESATFQNNYLGPKDLSPKAIIVKDSADAAADYRQQLNNKLIVVQQQLAVIDANKKVAGENTGLNVTELQRMLDLVNTRMEALLNNKISLEARIKKADERIASLTDQLNQEQSRNYQPGGQLLVKFHADNAGAADVLITYVVPNAGWAPAYDIRVDKLGDPVNLFYKANIYQNSGVSWSNVHLTLSTGNPNEGAQAPELEPDYLAFFMPSYPGTADEVRDRAAPAPVAKSMSIVGGRAEGAVYAIDGMQQHVTVDNAGINTSFNIDLPYSIPTDGQNHLVSIKEYSLPATYSYYAVPKLDNDAFLQAQVTNWEDLNLLPAATNIFYEGAYVGQGNIDPRNVKDTLSFSLGRDKKIIVQREKDKELRSTKTIGSNVREAYAYTITVRNTRKQPVTLNLLDQIPVSNDNNITVEDRETDGADYNETTGEVKWKLNIKAGETKKVKLGYTVKYPKGKTVTNLN